MLCVYSCIDPGPCAGVSTCSHWCLNVALLPPVSDCLLCHGSLLSVSFLSWDNLYLWERRGSHHLHLGSQ